MKASPGQHELLHALIEPFFPTPEALGEITPTSAAEMPRSFRALLAHHDHMTVTVEAFHASLVDVQVLEHRREQDNYTRKILLTRQDNGQVVQFGIVRVDLGRVSPEVREEILARETPLGRILIRNYDLRQVKLVELYRIEPGDELRTIFGATEAAVTYGRTAKILVDHQPAVELLEIVAPLNRPAAT